MRAKCTCPMARANAFVRTGKKEGYAFEFVIMPTPPQMSEMDRRDGRGWEAGV